jgi:hypothetical protein
VPLAEEKRFLLRLDPAIYRALRKWADDDLRSVNGQIEFLLRRALKEGGRMKGPGGAERAPEGPDEAD